jgi:predicted  nucleic acid-binding Zn-ribbon protein
MSTVRNLYQLQLVDIERDQKRQRLAQVESSLGESDDVVRARDAVVDTEQSLDQLRVQLRDLELEISTLNAKLKKNQDRLYSGRVRNPKELSNLQEEAAALRRRRSELEDGQLELMIAIEEDEAELAERQARLLQIETTWREKQADLHAEKEQLEVDMVELDEEISTRRTRLRAADLALYDELRDDLGGVGIALLKRGICQACGTDVPTGAARAVERGEGLHFCPTCRRLLSG